MHSAWVLAGFLLLVFLTALSGAAFPPGEWYAALRKPPLTPPNWIFGPVWTVLYVAMAVAAWLVWRAGGGALPLALWTLQLVLNGLWSWLFFGLERPGLALLEILLLLAALLATTAAFFPVRPLAGWLLVPYVAWVAFAAYLNAGIWQLSR
jgi:tryptophan-rich sensory protein